MNVTMMEDRLATSLSKDRRHPSRCQQTGVVTTVRPSGTSMGLAIAVAETTGEDVMTVINRVGNR